MTASQREVEQMGGVELVIDPRLHLVGNQTVRRSLPVRERRAVGPFVFLDHFGPQVLRRGEGFDVGPHPHIGLATVTYFLEGGGIHRDSLGSVQPILPGELNWMTAGRGIVHSERSPDDLRATGGRLHGLQLWVALPAAHEEDEPTFEHVPAGAIETVSQGGIGVRVLAGRAYGTEARVTTRSPLFLVEARLAAGQSLALPEEHAERAVYVVEGALRVGEVSIAAERLAVAGTGPCRVEATSATHLLLLGGAAMPEPRYIRWNFVSSSKARLDAAERDWREGRFPRIPTDDGELVPMP